MNSASILGVNDGSTPVNEVLFSQVSVCPEGEYLSSMSFSGGGRYIQVVLGTHHPDMGPEEGGYPPPPQTWDTIGYGWQAGGTHPTRMLSCNNCPLVTDEWI